MGKRMLGGVLGVVASVFVLAASAQAASVSFGPLKTYSTGDNSVPFDVAAGALAPNADPSLVVATRDLKPAAFTVLPPAGGGAFKAPVTFPSLPYPAEVTLGDVTGDGKLDAVIGAQQGQAPSLGVFPGNGAGGFGAMQPVDIGGQPGSTVIADFNSDGIADLATPLPFLGKLVVMFGKNGGGFNPRVEYSLPGTNPSGVDLVAEDFDGKNGIDLAVVDNQNNQVDVFLNNGAGVFTFNATYATGPNSTSIAGADFNQDGKVDLAVTATNANRVAVLFGKGNGEFINPQSTTVLGGPFGIAAGDVSLDGIPDLVTMNATGNNVAVLVGTGTGTFEAPQFYAIAPNAQPYGMDLFDLTGDGKLDIIVANTAVSSVSVLLNTTGPSFAISPQSKSFGEQRAGTVSSAQTFTVSNPGTQPLKITEVALAGANPAAFKVGNDTCKNQTVQPGGQCTVAVAFAPPSAGAYSAALQFSDNASVNKQSVPLSGFGTAPVFTVAPGGYVYPAQPVGTQSPAQEFTVTNAGTAPLTIDSVDLGGDDPHQFKILTDGCSNTQLAAGDTCKLTAAFAPTTAGPHDATLVFKDDDASGTEQVVLVGRGTAPELTFSPAGLDFGTVAVGDSAGPDTLTVKNAGSGEATIESVTIGGAQASDYSVDDNGCTGGLQPDDECQIKIDFTPGAAGPRTAQVQVEVQNAGQAVAPLLGQGGVPEFDIQPGSKVFPPQQAGTESQPQAFVVTNPGQEPLSITQVTLAGTDPQQFKILGETCRQHAIPPSGACVVQVVYAPDEPGSHTATLDFEDNAPGPDPSVPLAGTGTEPDLEVTPASKNFGVVRVGERATQNFTVRNDGDDPVTIDTTFIGGSGARQFEIVKDDCRGATLAAGETCVVRAAFAPERPGARQAHLTIVADGDGGQKVVQLAGTAVAPALALSPGSLDFGSQPVGTRSTFQTITATNTGKVPLTIGKPRLVGPDRDDFGRKGGTCQDTTLQPGDTCIERVRFGPRSVGTAFADLAVPVVGEGEARAVLIGVGTKAEVAIVPQEVGFVSTPTGTETTPQPVTLVNVGDGPLEVSSVTIAGADQAAFKLGDETCTKGSIPQGGRCTIHVRFAPTSVGPLSADLRIADNATGSPQDVPLSGIGTSPSPPPPTPPGPPAPPSPSPAPPPSNNPVTPVNPAPPPPAPPAQTATATLVGRTVTVRNGRAPLTLRCRTTGLRRCVGSAQLSVTRTVRRRGQRRAVRRTVSLGRATFSVTPGARRTVTVRLTRSARRELAKRKRWRVRLVLRTQQAGRRVRTTQTATVQLRVPTRRR